MLHITSLCTPYRQLKSFTSEDVHYILLTLHRSLRRGCLSAWVLSEQPRGHKLCKDFDNLLVYFTVFTGIESVPPCTSDLGVNSDEI